MVRPLTFPSSYTIDEKLYELVERIASTHYSRAAEAHYHLEHFIATARKLIEEYNDVGEDESDG